MTRILVTGGNGGLGRELMPRLQAAGYTVRVMSRSPRPAHAPAGMEWATADLRSGSGLREAVLGVEAIIHAATSPITRTREVDVDGTRRVLEAGRAADVGHFIYVSIVGIERIPFAYYQAKVAAEAAVRQGGLPYTILRATQFHGLIDRFLQPLRNWPVAFLFTDFKFQSVDTGEVAARLCQIAARPPAGLLPDMGGPEVLTLGQMAEVWFAAQGKRCKLIRLPLPGAVGRGFRGGYNTCPDHRDGTITWDEWVARKYARRSIETAC